MNTDTKIIPMPMFFWCHRVGEQWRRLVCVLR